MDGNVPRLWPAVQAAVQYVSVLFPKNCFKKQLPRFKKKVYNDIRNTKIPKGDIHGDNK
jgi:hypothetical protein